jgi:hypothetical protein
VFAVYRFGDEAGVRLRSRRVFGALVVDWAGVGGAGTGHFAVAVVVAAALNNAHREKCGVFFSQRLLLHFLFGSFCGSAGAEGSHLRLFRGHRRSWWRNCGSWFLL